MVSEPAGVIRPMLVPAQNQRFPSRLAVMSEGEAPRFGNGNWVICPPGVILPMAEG